MKHVNFLELEKVGFIRIMTILECQVIELGESLFSRKANWLIGLQVERNSKRMAPTLGHCP
jgi:hypothetical protein